MELRRPSPLVFAWASTATSDGLRSRIKNQYLPQQKFSRTYRCIIIQVYMFLIRKQDKHFKLRLVVDEMVLMYCSCTNPQKLKQV